MTRRFTATIALVWCMTAPAAAQPISQSMAQCAGLSDAMSTMVSKADNRDSLEHLTDIWTEAALRQAGDEGRTDGVIWVAAHAAEMREKFTERGAVLSMMSAEFREWIAYCRSLAKAKGVNIAAAR